MTEMKSYINLFNHVVALINIENYSPTVNKSISMQSFFLFRILVLISR